MNTPNDEPEDLTAEIMKQAQKDVLVYINTELKMRNDFRKFRRVLLSVMSEN